ESDRAHINDYLGAAEQYRLVRERPWASGDRQNIARLLFDLLDEEEKILWNMSWPVEIRTYDQYVQFCVEGKRNELLEYAGNILCDEDKQKKFVGLARASIPDFHKVGTLSGPDQQQVIEILNQLLPVQGAKAVWTPLTLETIGLPDAAKDIMNQAKGANLSYMLVETEAGERIVYYSFSGGRRAQFLKLRPEMAPGTDNLIDGIIYRDVRALMKDVEPDPWFTSLPVVRDAEHLIVREFGRYLDSERLIATVLRRDMTGVPLRHIKVFTLMDTCRSCGGFVLPRLKLDFPEARFSVGYLKNYGLQ
ncbi:MAG TPA: deaminase domain-containing protein, partial [Pseudomonas sp.]|uniref:deaminase domain-containing protein n=1 Tax=Pseudomonas sp. TaxID=306 RepID=UPI002ED88B14